jgi:hypothetical protein
MQHDPSVAFGGAGGHDRVCGAVRRVLDEARRRGITRAELAALTGIGERTIKSYQVDGKEPSLGNGLALVAACGPWAVSALLAVIHYAARPLDEGDELALGALVAEGIGQFARIAEAAADGRIDHTEEPACREAADRIIARLVPLSSAGART